jgi:signal transduction histidine kinase
VNLDAVAAPQDGLIVAAPRECAKHFAASSVCRKHYESLRAANDYELIQCPYGFASCAVRTGDTHLALTGLVPFPRLGGEAERHVAKRHPNNKISMEAIRSAGTAVQNAIGYFEGLERESLRRQSFALHEIRKLNRTVKQTAERLCNEQRPDHPDVADPRLVQIWKSAELMSAQFEVIELLANEDLANLPLKTTASLYRIFHKCARIYNEVGKNDRVNLHPAHGYSGMIRACDKTLPIIPSALIENALKYSIPGTPINVTLSSEGGYCVARVANEANLTSPLTMSAFAKGVRIATDTEGSGNGLHLVRLVAEQHQGNVMVSSRPKGRLYEVTFTIAIPESHDTANGNAASYR